MTAVMEGRRGGRENGRQEGERMTTTATAEPRIIDVREIEGPERCRAVLALFDRLAPGESLVAVSHHVPRKLLGLLQAERKGVYEWSPLESGPERFRTLLTRRAAEVGSRREVTEALSWDHDRLDALDGRTFDRLGLGDAAGARASWAEFTVGLRRHIRFEEDLLFPAFEGKAGFPPDAGPTAVMRLEHREIERLVDAVGSALAEGKEPTALRAELHRVLGEHNLKEEQVLYPGTDRCLDPAERDALVARIQAS
jgi:regulator of cell morphogenesis and NO signaling